MKRWTATDSAFALATAVIIVVTHAIAYLTHEYAHSFTAWALGYMANPLALDYGAATPGNLILLASVGDNVQYEPILQGGHGLAVAAIALAGAFIGNALLYVGVYAAATRVRQRPFANSCTYWLLLMCAGNVWSYVPIRAITTHADIAIAASGLHIPVLVLFPFLLIPSLLLASHFFARVCPRFIPVIAPGGTARTALVIGMTGLWFFFLYGGAGLFGSYGPVSQAFSLVSALLLLPFAIVWLWHRCQAVGNGSLRLPSQASPVAID